MSKKKRGKEKDGLTVKSLLNTVTLASLPAVGPLAPAGASEGGAVSHSDCPLVYAHFLFRDHAA